MAQALPQFIVVKTRIQSVLVVDDDDDWRAMMADVLAEAGFSVTTARDGRAAVQSWQRMKAHVVVTDVQMPGMDGCELLATLQSIDRNISVIVMTAEDMSDTGSALAGAFRIIRKPAATDAVVSAVTEALLNHRPPRYRRIANAARAITDFGRKRRRVGLAVAGVGAAAAVAVLIAGLRSLVI